MKLLFVTDLHGGNAVFRKSLRLFKAVGADVLLVGGDICGKYLVPVLVERGRSLITEKGKSFSLGSEVETEQYINRVGEFGGYAVRCSAEEAERLRSDESFREEVLKRERVGRLRDWYAEAKRLELVPERFLLNLGNDDPFYLDAEVERETGLATLENRSVPLACGFSIVSCGYTNPTPWNCPRDCSEEELWSRLNEKFLEGSDTQRVIANFHCPPRSTHLDRAPRLDSELRPVVGIDGVELAHVGSTAVRRAIEQYGPAVGLHGHIHESYGKERIGKTVCANPGSAYHSGELRAVVVHLNCGVVRGVQLVREK